MRVLVLHSDVPPDAPPDDQDTLLQAAAVEHSLARLGHEASCAVFAPDATKLEALLTNENPDLVFNLVESVWGRGLYAPLAVQMLADLGVPYTGAPAAAMAATGDKLLTAPNAGDDNDMAMFARLGLKPMAVARTEAEIAAEAMPKGCVKLEQMI